MTDHHEIDNIDAGAETYCLYGRAAPRNSSAVAKAKKKYAEEHDVDYHELTGRKVASLNRRHHGMRGAVVTVTHRPTLNALEEIR